MPKRIAIVILLTIHAATAGAGVIYDNQASVDNGRHAEFLGQILADDFILQPGAAIATDFHWTGFYASDNTPPATDTFRVRVFESVAGLPSLTPLLDTSIAASRTDTLTDVVIFDLYSYSVEIAPLALNPGDTYWFSVFNETKSSWYWGVELNAGNSVVADDPTDGISAWLSIGDNHDFQVTGVPEPTTLALFGLGLAGAGFAARRRKATAV